MAATGAGRREDEERTREGEVSEDERGGKEEEEEEEEEGGREGERETHSTAREDSNSLPVFLLSSTIQVPASHLSR